MNIVIKIRRLKRKVRRIKGYIFFKSRFKTYHLSDLVMSVKYINCRYVSLGRNVFIGPNARIQAVILYEGVPYSPNITIGDGVSIQQNLHLTCANKVEIGDNTAVAANVSITDIRHPYEDINVPIEKQNIQVKETIIGKDSKINNGAVILPGCHIGNHCMIGANSVVGGSIPDYSVVSGIPAHIIRRYDFINQKWRKTDAKGSFIEDNI